MNKLNIVDMFCGGGGESTGLIDELLRHDPDVREKLSNVINRFFILIGS